MPIRTYECPDCEKQFSFLHLKSDEPPPNNCPHCGSYVGPDQTPLPALVNFPTKTSKSADAVYRAMEDSSAVRAQEVERLTGEDASHIKITDLRDNQRPGDIAAVSRSNPVSEAMKSASGIVGFQGHQEAAGFASATGTGPFPHIGNATREKLGASHHEIRHAVQSRGQMQPAYGGKK